MPIVEVTLVNLARTVSNDEAGHDFPRLAMSVLSCCTSAQSMLQQQKKSSCCGSNREEGDNSLQSKLMKDVMKFVQVKDKYTALCSLLLKSRAFYQTHPMETEGENTVPVVDLPRTKMGKPFIPKTWSASETEANCYPLSVSHQFPFCGIARLVDTENSSSLNLGMDIVVFEPLRRDLYKGAVDFLLVFQDSFTQWEWNRIHSYLDDDDDMMMEFYLRWSMKESYTKALGLGLHLQFSTFETRLNVVDDEFHCDTGSCLSIWSRVSKRKEGVHFRGCVIHEKKETQWDFYFLPLFCENEAAGCACVCFGPLGIDEKSDSSDDAGFEERISWTALDDLSQWHTKEQ